MLSTLLDLIAPILTALAWVSIGGLAVFACALVGAATLAALFLLRAVAHLFGDAWLRVARRERGSRLPVTASIGDLMPAPHTRPIRTV